jgi:D-alanine-D-alanine ligase
MTALPLRPRVAVVLGGRSSEREISLESGRHIFQTIDRARWDPTAVYMDARGGLWAIPLPLVVQNTCADIDARLAHDAERLPWELLAERFDIVYIGLHGKYGEDGCFQGLLELIDVPYVGSGVLGSALGMDKRVQRDLLRQAGIDVPATVDVPAAAWAADADAIVARIAAAPGLPCVVKPSREGCSTALAVPQDVDALRTSIDEALRWDTHALVEEHLSGVEVTVVVLEDAAGRPRAFAPTETPAKGAFLTIEEKFLPGYGENITPARLPAAVLDAVRDTAERAFTALQLRVFARIDMYVVDTDTKADTNADTNADIDAGATPRIIVGEPNTLPGSSPSSTIFLGPIEEGILPHDLLTTILERSMAAHGAKRGPLA